MGEAMVPVRKINGDFCFCVDYHQLDAVTSKDVFLNQLSGKYNVFSTSDAPMDIGRPRCMSLQERRIVTIDGLYEFCIVALGHCNFPATFQRLMQ